MDDGLDLRRAIHKSECPEQRELRYALVGGAVPPGSRKLKPYKYKLADGPI